MKRLLLALGALTSGTAAAETVDLNFGDENARLAFSAPLSRVMTGARGVYDLGLLVHREDEADDLLQGHLGMVLTGDAGARDANVTAGLGARAVILDEGPFSATALQLGGQVEVRIPEINRLSFNAYLWGAPPVLSFGDADGVFEYATAIDYQVIREASLYVGYRQLKVKVEDADTVTADTGFHIGFKLNF